MNMPLVFLVSESRLEAQRAPRILQWVRGCPGMTGLTAKPSVSPDEANPDGDGWANWFRKVEDLALPLPDEQDYEF